jgi:FixJ family two-component response regulator
VLSGQETFEVLRQMDATVRVMFSSGYSAEQLADVARASGVSFLPKPYRADQLARALRALLDQEATRE